MRMLIRILLCLPLDMAAFPLTAQILDAPENIAAVLVIKLSALEKSISSSKDVRVYVLGSSKIVEELKKGIGQPVGQSTLISVDGGDKLPTEKPNILYVDDPSKLTQAIAFTRSHNILSITGKPELVKEGITLGIGVGNDGKPKVMLNLNSTVEENLTWNPAIFKIARTIK